MSQWCRSTLCGHPLPALTNNWTHGAASRHTFAPISHTRPSPRSRSYYSFPVPLRVGGWVGMTRLRTENSIQSIHFSGTTGILYHPMLLSIKTATKCLHICSTHALLHFSVYFTHYSTIYVKMSTYLQFHFTPSKSIEYISQWTILWMGVLVNLLTGYCG